MDIPLKAMIQTQKTEKVMIFFKTRNTSWSARISLLFQALPRDAEQAKQQRLSEVIIKEAVQEKGEYMNIEELTKKLEKNREDFLRKERDLNISISMSLTYDEAIVRLDELKTAYEEEKKKIEREIFKIKSKKAQQLPYIA